MRDVLFHSSFRDIEVRVYSKYLEAIAKRSSSHAEEANILGATVQKVLVRTNWHLRFALQCLHSILPCNRYRVIQKTGTFEKPNKN